MNEQLQTALAEMLGKANSGIDAGASFLQAQLPDAIQQLLVWKASISLLGSLTGIVLMLAITYTWTRAVRWASEDNRDWVDYPHLFIPLVFGSVFAGVASLLMLSIDWLQIWLAPKIYLIEYAASLAK